MINRSLAGLALLGSLALVPVSHAQEASTMARALNDAFSAVYEKVAPAVVVIEVQPGEAVAPVQLPQGLDFFFRTPDGRRMDPGPDQGSGFVFRPDGLIMTNNHVVQNGEGGKITVQLLDGRKFPAELVGRDERSDIAVLRIDAKNLPAVTLGDSDAAKVGQFAFAIGAPFDLPYTFTSGIVSAKGRTNLTGSRNYEEFIQTDASINPGNSGGPLCDIDGQVVGVNTMISGINRGLGFAVPINIAKTVAEQLITNGRVSRPWLGIGISGLEENEQRRALFPGVDSGVVVESIERNTPAYRSQLQPGDVILRVDGRKVSLARDLQREILSKTIGQTVNLEIWRGGRTVSIPIQTGEHPDGLMQASSQMRPVPVIPSPSTAPPTRPLREESALPFGLAVSESPDVRGVKVEQIAPGSPAEVGGLLPGDIITELGGQPVISVRDYEDIVSAAGSDRALMVLVEREGERTFAILKP
ncbi:MAG: trypsin-like peptidase domain-containing protein [Terrimicrobiaceae bacterium]